MWHWRLKRVMMLKIQLLIIFYNRFTMKTLILNYNQNFLYFSSNKRSLGEQKILFFQKHWKNVLNQNFWMAEYITFRIFNSKYLHYTLRPPAMFGKICLLLNKTKSTSIHAERQWSVKTHAVELCWFKTMNASQHNTYKSSRATECDVQSDHKHKPTPFVLLNGFCFVFLLKEQILAN